jgi:hypothetical protein
MTHKVTHWPPTTQHRPQACITHAVTRVDADDADRSPSLPRLLLLLPEAALAPPTVHPARPTGRCAARTDLSSKQPLRVCACYRGPRRRNEAAAAHAERAAAVPGVPSPRRARRHRGRAAAVPHCQALARLHSGSLQAPTAAQRKPSHRQVCVVCAQVPQASGPSQPTHPPPAHLLVLPMHTPVGRLWGFMLLNTKASDGG